MNQNINIDMQYICYKDPCEMIVRLSQKRSQPTGWELLRLSENLTQAKTKFIALMPKRISGLDSLWRRAGVFLRFICFIMNYMCLRRCACLWVCVCEYRCMRMSEEGVKLLQSWNCRLEEFVLRFRCPRKVATEYHYPQEKQIYYCFRHLGTHAEENVNISENLFKY